MLAIDDSQEFEIPDPEVPTRTEAISKLLRNISFLIMSLEDRFDKKLHELDKGSQSIYLENTDMIFRYYMLDDGGLGFSIGYNEPESGKRVIVQSGERQDAEPYFSTLEANEVQLTGVTQNDKHIDLGTTVVDEKTPHYATAIGIANLSSMVETEAACLEIRSVKLTGDNIYTTNDLDTLELFAEPGTRTINARSARKVLDQFGLNTPDPGTT